MKQVQVSNQSEPEPGRLPPGQEVLECLSAFMDGQSSPEDMDALWRDLGDARLREAWDTYHLVGDVLRAQQPVQGLGDARLLPRLREQLAQEAKPQTAWPAAARRAWPAILGDGQEAANDAVFRWKLVAAVASFFAVAVMGWAALGGAFAPVPGPAEVVQGPVAPVRPLPQQQQIIAMDTDSGATMLRDARLDQLLAAHQQVSVSALGATPGLLRNATFEGAGR
ncbi:MAG: sigma-E factor negative regulatory protein [Burkholderiaceae bacterium]|jgi:sigma-E factor negative regulatory protein RseA|nr:sigma-E factor negative regulatory protein [Burkholderiaceae bacterium]